MINVSDLGNPTVRDLVRAINANDRDAFYGAFTPDATMSDDGSDRELRQWAEREIFSSHGHMDIVSASDDGTSLIADYRNDTWGAMRTTWTFHVQDGKINRVETGQA
jgi:hypothetical protein